MVAGTSRDESVARPVGSLAPNGQHVVFELINIFRDDDEGRIQDECAQTDNRSVVRQLRAESN
jgi:predicted ester cyclase